MDLLFAALFGSLFDPVSWLAFLVGLTLTRAWQVLIPGVLLGGLAALLGVGTGSVIGHAVVGVLLALLGMAARRAFRKDRAVRVDPGA